MPEVADAALPTNSYDLHQEWGNTGNPHHDIQFERQFQVAVGCLPDHDITAKSGAFYTITTGKDDNKDGAINDRPPGVPKNSEVGPHFFDVSFNFSKAFELNHAATPSQRAATLQVPDPK